MKIHSIHANSNFLQVALSSYDEGDINTYSTPSTTYSRSVGIDLASEIKSKITNVQTVQLEPGANPTKKYPAAISGNDIKILPVQSSDENYIQVLNITPPSRELGRSIGIDINNTIKTKLNNMKTIQISTSSLPETRALPIATADGNTISLRHIGVNHTSVMRTLSLYDPMAGGTGIFFDLETSVEKKNQ